MPRNAPPSTVTHRRSYNRDRRGEMTTQAAKVSSVEIAADTHLPSSIGVIKEAMLLAEAGSAAVLGCGRCTEIPIRLLNNPGGNHEFRTAFNAVVFAEKGSARPKASARPQADSPERALRSASAIPFVPLQRSILCGANNRASCRLMSSMFS